MVQIIPKNYNARARLNEALAHLRAGQIVPATALFEEVRRIEPENVEAIFYLARLALQRRDGARAKTLAEKGIHLDKERPELWYMLGEACGRQKELGNAVSAFERAAALSPNLPGLQLAYGIALSRTDQHEEGAKRFRLAIQQQPDQSAGYHNLGNALVKLARYDEAVAAFRKAAALNPQNAPIQYGLGRALLWIERYEEALSYLSRALDLQPAYLQIVSYKILALRHLGRHDEADAIEGLHDMVTPVQLERPAEFSSLSAFNAAMREEITSHPALTTEFDGRATRNGAKVDGMFAANKTPLFEIFEREIRKAFDVAIARMPRRDGLPIPFHVEGGYRADMWANVMYRGGHQIAHNHPAGWFSASYYNTLPGCVVSSGEAHEGWIEFGGTAYDFPAAPDTPLRQIQPEEGMMVVFPSYIFHRTIPFESDEIRISCAFDAKPLKWGR